MDRWEAPPEPIHVCYPREDGRPSPLTSEDMDRYGFGDVLCGIGPAKKYEEHASYSIDIELPTCLACGVRAIDCPCPYNAPKTSVVWPEPVRARALSDERRAELNSGDWMLVRPAEHAA